MTQLYNPTFGTDTYTPDRLIAGNHDIVTDSGTVLTGQGVLARGSLMGARTVNSLVGAGPVGTGNGTLTAIAGKAATKPGVYKIVFSGATAFECFDPTGDVILDETTLGAKVSNQIGFTLTAGGTAFVAGDSFTITVTGDNKLVLCAAAAVDGSQYPTCLLVDQCDTTSGDVVGAGTYVSGEFNSNAVTFGAGTTVANTKAALAALSIYLKNQVTTTGAGI